MISDPKKSSSLIKLAPSSWRSVVAQLLVACLLLQGAAPVLASQPGPRRPGAATSSPFGGAAATLRGLALGVGDLAATILVRVNAALTPQENWNVVLTPVNTEFHNHAGLDYHQPSKKLILSANAPAGAPNNFELLAADGGHSAFSNVAGLGGDVLVAAARDGGQGASPAAFPPGTLFTTTGAAGAVARISPVGAAVQNPWATLPAEEGLITGLHLDRTGVFGGDLLVVTEGGGVWRVNASAIPTRLAQLGTPLAGVAAVSNDPERYGPWAGRVLVGAREQGSVYAVNAQGQAEALAVGVNPQDIDVVPAHENFYALDPASRKLLGAAEGAFAGIIGDILITQASPGLISRVRWDGAGFAVGTLAEAAELKQVAFAPAGVGALPAVKQVYEKIAVVRHAPQLNSGRVEGTLWQLTGEETLLDGTDTITSDLLVPGTPNVTASAPASYGGTVEGTESAAPSGYGLTIKGRASVRHVVTRTDPIELENVPFPPAPAGTRDAQIRRAGETVGDPATLRHLDVSGNAGSVAVPPGTYGRFAVGGRNVLVLGVAGSPEPTVYNLEELSLTGSSELRLAGRVTLRVRNRVTLVGSTVGAADDPKRLRLEVADGVELDSVKVSGNGVLYGVVRAPQGNVTVEGNGRVRGTVACDRLLIDGNGVLQITENDLPPPPVNRPPTADAGPAHTITLPANTAALEGTASDDGLPSGSTLAVTWKKVSGPGSVTFAAPNSAATSATFGAEGDYVLKLTASDGQLSSSDTTTVTIIPRNQPPAVEAGPEQTIKLPAPAELRGTVTDDALPRGSSVTVNWSVVGGPGPVVFADPHAAATTATFAAPGVYTLRLSANDTEFTVSDDLVVTVLKNEPPVVNAGADREVTLPNTAALAGVVTDDGLPAGSTLALNWEKISGPGPVTFADPHSAATVATFEAPGAYTLRLSASDTEFTVSDEVVVVVKNDPPVVNAGPDQEVTLPNTVALNGAASDDGLPRGSTLETFWGMVSGPAPVIFHDAFAPATPVTFTAPGTYVLRLTASDSQLSADDELTVVVRSQPFTSRTYTLDADFNEGNFVNVTPRVANQLQLDDTTRTFNFIWVAVSSKGTIVKIDTETGAILGEYSTSPAGQPKDPSRTTVDNNGNVWAGNRAGFSVVNVGLVENGQCVDRNNNGVIDTSTGYDDIKPWLNTNNANTNGGVTLAQDECIRNYTRVNAQHVRHVSVTKENDVWVTGWGGRNQGFFDLIDGRTGLVKRSERAVGYGGYGGLVDKSGVLWSARKLLRWDTSKPLTGTNAVNGMAFTLHGGRATWDRAGKTSAQSPSETVWVEDRVPYGAAAVADGDEWSWVSANPAPFSGTLAHQSSLDSTTHQHYFDGADDMLGVGPGDTLFAYVYLDPANPPSHVMLQWNDADWNWEHRAYWGTSPFPADDFPWGVEGTASRRHVGPLPAAGQWVRLEVPASQVGLQSSGANWRGYDNHDSYGLCIDSQGNVWNTSWAGNKIHKFAPDGTKLGTFQHGSEHAQGCVVDKNDDVWIAHSRDAKTVGRLKNNGFYIGKLHVGDGPTGVAVDAAGKIWATNHNGVEGGTVVRIDPNLGDIGADGVTPIGRVDFTSRPLGGTLYNYSDMTGSTLSGKPDAGTWSAVYDSGKEGAEWGRVGWTANVCGDGQVAVSVAASEDGKTFGPAETVTNGADPNVADGRYLRVSVSFKRASSGESPVLYDLSVGTSGYTLPDAPNAAPTAFAGADQMTTLPDAARLQGAACDDGFPRGSSLSISWSQVSGPGAAVFTNANSTTPGVTFSLPGDYVLRLTAGDGQHTAGDEVTVKALPANMAPVVYAGPDQTITLPNTAALGGTASDDGLPAGGTLSTFWSQLSGPGVVKFDDPDSPATRAVFPVPGAYTLRLAGGDTHRTSTDDVVINVNPSPALVGATLSLAAANAGPYVTGSQQPVRATLRNSAGNPLANYGVEFKVAGPNATSGSAVTDAAGVATFSYAGTNAGTDTVGALVGNSPTDLNSQNTVAMAWTLTAASPPTTQGWIGSPLHGGSVTGVVPVTVGPGVTLAQWTAEYWPASNPSAVTALGAGAQAGPGATLAALDTTVLANGNYFIRLTATDSAGQGMTSHVLITVTGENKPGRVTLSITDLTVPVSGIPITVERQYDSLERHTVGDFGHGWSLEMAGPRLEVSPDHDVTLTDPVSGRRVTFQFAPQSFGFPFSFMYQPAYAPEPGVYGKLSADGCGTLTRTSGGVACLLSADPYRPTTYTYADPYGRVYTMTAAGKLVSIKNLDGNTLAFGPNGITSSAGNLTVAFARDSQGRIRQMTDPAGKTYDYTYDAAGDLVAVKMPDAETPLRYEYDPGHFFRKGTDSRGNVEQLTAYYPDGRLKSVTDAMGKTTTYSYDLAANTTTVTHPDNSGTTVERRDARGLLLSETDPLGRTKGFTYDANRNKLTETDALGKTTTYSYDAGGHMKSVTDATGKTTGFVNNQYGQPVSSTDALGKVRTLKYDGDSNLVNAGDELGTQLALTWNDRGSPLSLTDGAGKTTHFTYDAYGNVLSKTDPLGRTTTYSYDPMGRVRTMTESRGITRFAYDPMGRVTSVTDPLGNETAYEYDANGNRTGELDARGQTTAFEYDAANRLSRVTHPDGSTISYTYNFRGQKLTETTAGPAPAAGLAAPGAAAAGPSDPERTTEYVYDAAGQLVRVILPDESEVSFAYDETGRVKTATDERGKTYTYEYDPACGCTDRLTKITNPAGQSSTYTYDATGRRTSFIDPNGRETRYEYDARDRVLKITYSDATFVTNTYDGEGRLAAATDQEGRVTRYAYDGLGNIVSATDALGQTTQFTYDQQENLLSSTDALGRTTRYEYDALNRVVKRTLPLGMSELYTYDRAGNVATRTDFRGKQTGYDYDPMDRLIAKRPDPTLGEPMVTYSYTSTGRRRSMTDASGTTNYTYDLRDRLLTKQTPQGALTYGYDRTGGLVSVRSSNADGVSVDYAYDDAGRLEKVIDNRLGGAASTYAYDAIGNLKTETRANGVRSDYTYNLLNRLSNLTVGRAGVTQASYAYTHDRTGRRLSSAELDGRAVTYTYDALYRLTRESVAGSPSPASNGAVDYTYDAVSNRLRRISSLAGVAETTSSYDANDRLTSDAYDANGNTRGAGGRSFTYDFEDRLKAADGGAVRVVYDGDGNLAAKTVDGVTTRYLVDDNNPTDYSQVLEELVGGQVVRQYTYGNAIVSQRRRVAGGAWAASFYTTDGAGSVRQLTDASGAVTDSYAYDAFGNLVAQTGSTPNAYLYRGERFDADLGLYHLRARSYDPNRGRFTTTDPFPGFIDEPTSLHKYLYANADPVNFIDPLGLATAAEYGALVKRIALRTVAALRTLGRAVACVFFYVASWLAAYHSYAAWAGVRAVAQRMRLGFCICKISRDTPGYKRPTPKDNRDKGKDFERFLEDLFFGLGFDIGPQASFNTPRGRRFMDIDLSWGNWRGGIEAKVGDSPYTQAQRWKDRYIDRTSNRGYPVRVIRFPQWKCKR